MNGPFIAEFAMKGPFIASLFAVRLGSRVVVGVGFMQAVAPRLRHRLHRRVGNRRTVARLVGWWAAPISHATFALPWLVWGRVGLALRCHPHDYAPRQLLLSVYISYG